MTFTATGSFLFGLSTALVLGGFLRILFGMRLNLYFINPDSRQLEESLIPLTSELKKRSLLRTLMKRHWKESIEVTLIDDQGRSSVFHLGYHLWRRYYAVLTNPSRATVNKRPMKKGKKYFLKTGSELSAGDRTFKIVVTPTAVEKMLRQDFHLSESQEASNEIQL
jgi:hypothetical protein